MIEKRMTISDAAYRWVSEMNMYPHDMIQTLVEAKPFDWKEVTMPRIGDRVYVFGLPDRCSFGEIENHIRESDVYRIKPDDGNTVEAGIEDFDVGSADFLPMWGWLWSFKNSADYDWLKEPGSIEKMSQCGFRIYKNDEWGYFFGIDGCGYSFYEKHWIPLYKERGLQWHDPESEQQC